MRRSLSGAVQIAIGTALGQGAILALTPFITRLYTPAELGTATVFLAWASILTPIVSMRLEFLIPTASEDSAHWLVRASLTVAASVSILSGAVYWILVPSSDGLLAVLFAVTCFSLGSIAVLGQALVRQHAYRRIGISKATVGLVQVTSQVGFASAPAALQMGIALGYLFGIVPQLSGRKRSVQRALISRIDRLQLLKRGLLLALAGLANTVSVWSPMVVLGLAYSNEPAGLYAAAQRLTIAPVGFLIAALLPVVTGDIGSAVRAGTSIRQSVKRWVGILFPLGLVVALAIVAVPDAWVIGILGGDFKGAAPYVLALAPLLFMQVVAGPLGQILVLTGNVRAQLVWDITRLAVLTVVIAIALWLAVDPIGLIWLTTVVFALGYFSYLVVVWKIIR